MILTDYIVTVIEVGVGLTAWLIYSYQEQFSSPATLKSCQEVTFFLALVLNHEKDSTTRIADELAACLDIQPNDVEDLKKIAKKVKDKMKENHLQAWKEKPQHGYLMRTREDLTQKNETASNAWMKRSIFSSHVEGYLCAIQEEEIFTNALKSRRVKDVEVDANCRRCRNSKETIQHVVAACPRLGASMYLPWRHNKVANIIYQNVLPKNDGNK